MLSPRLTNCPECANIPSLIKKIDCKLAELGNNLYNNISYMLNKSVPSNDILQLIGYRRILMYKYYNPNYVHTYSVQMIASRVIRLTSGCVSKCNEPERCLEEPCDITIVQNPTTTTTTSITPSTSTTTTSTTIIPTTTTSTSSSTSTTTSTSTTVISTTTTTTTEGPLRYFYNVIFYNCGNCVTPSGAGSFNNSQPLTAGMYYINSSGTIIYINSFNSVLPGTSVNNILDSSQQVNCVDIICPTTTTTTSLEPTTTTTTTICQGCIAHDVTIGTQVWSGCNLDVTTYQNGDPIPQVTDPTAWAALTTGAWCYYDNDADNGCTYGKLYNWYAVNDPRGLAPAGYRVPTNSDFTTLYTYLGGEAAAGGALKEAGTEHWITPNTGATNSSGFTALPGGVRNVPTGAFNLIYVYGFWWSATDDGNDPYSLQLLYNDGGVVGWGTRYYKTDGHSVRLIKDSSITTSTTTLAPTGFNTIYTHFESL
jgi:uncharacterized protein (TIGR02145 family)